jgi:hypothetical protein
MPRPNRILRVERFNVIQLAADGEWKIVEVDASRDVLAEAGSLPNSLPSGDGGVAPEIHADRVKINHVGDSQAPGPVCGFCQGQVRFCRGAADVVNFEVKIVIAGMARNAILVSE